MAHGKNLKNRRVKVSRKNRKNGHYTKVAGCAEVREAWKRGNMRKNYSAMGLASDANAVVSQAARDDSASVSDSANASGDDDVADSARAPLIVDTLQLKVTNKGVDLETSISSQGLMAARRPANCMSEEDMAYIAPLVKKHGSDVTAMFRDHVLNNFQHPKGWLRRKTERYERHLQDQLEEA